MHKVPNILRDFSVTAAGQYAATAARVARGLLLAMVLTPLSLGSVAIMNLVISLLQYSDLGVGNAVARQIPVSEGAGKEGEAAAWPWYALLANAIGGCIAVVMCTLWALTLGAQFDASVRWAVVAAGVSGLFLGVTVAIQKVLQAQRKFSRAVAILVSLALANLVLSVAGARAFGTVGVFAGQVCATAFAFGIALSLGALSGLPEIRWRTMGSLVILGFPITLMAFMGYGLENVDQIMILNLLNREQLGIYSIVLAAGGALYLLPLSVSNVIGPRLLLAYGRDARPESIFRYTWRPVRVLSSVLPAVILLAWVAGPLLIVNFLPEYVEAIAPMRVYLVGEFFLGLNLGVSNTLLAFKKHPYNVGLMLACIGLNVALDLLFVGLMGLGLTGVALGSLCTYACYWFLHSGLVRRQFTRSFRVIVGGNLVAAIPGFLLVAYLLWVSSQTGLASIDVARDGVATIAACLFGVAWWRLGRGHGWWVGSDE